jgi:hypothetical protein
MGGKVAAHEGGGLDKIEPFWISRTKTIRHGLDGGRGDQRMSPVRLDRDRWQRNRWWTCPNRPTLLASGATASL